MGEPKRASGGGGRLTRRGFLTRSTAALGAAAAVGVGSSVGARAESEVSMPTGVGSATEPCWGAHQSGIATAKQSFATFVGLNLTAGANRDALTRLMMVWTDDIERLTQGSAALADSEGELACVPARLTVTVGFGPGFFKAADLQSVRPQWLKPLPDFAVDKLEPQWSAGDLLLQVGADDPITVSHAVRVLLSDAERFASVRWTQQGFHRAVGTTPTGDTGRNLMGQIDGTVNPAAGTPDFDEIVWANSGPSWLVGGTGVVVRRIRMDLRKWISIDRPSREQIIGRRISDGAPLTGGSEFDTPDLGALGPDGLPVIADFAHVRLAHPQQPIERIFRRPYNYDDGHLANGEADSGLLFVAYAADPVAQYVPIQRRLDKVDLLNKWTTPVGSAVFAVPPGFSDGGWLGQTLLA